MRATKTTVLIDPAKIVDGVLRDDIQQSARRAGLEVGDWIERVLWHTVHQIMRLDCLEIPCCRVCGCTEDTACVTFDLEHGCAWAFPGLCTECYRQGDKGPPKKQGSGASSQGAA